MPRPISFGTNAFTGLNSKRAPHLIGDTELQDAINCKYEDDGSVRPINGNLIIHSNVGPSFNGTAGLANLKYGGADHLIYKPTFPTFQDGAALSAVSFNSNHVRFLSDGKKLYSFDGSKNQVTNGTYVRNHGAPDPFDGPTDYLGNSQNVCRLDTSYTTYPITSLTNQAGTGLVVLDASFIDSTFDGALVRFDDLVDGAGSNLWHTFMEAEDNNLGKAWVLEYISGTTAYVRYPPDVGGGRRLNFGGTFGTSTSVGEVTHSLFPNTILNLSGDVNQPYKYASSVVMEMSDGSVVESSLDVMRGANTDTDYTSDLFHESYNIRRNRVVELEVMLRGTNFVASYTDDAAASVYTRIYRTKGGGSTYYLLDEIAGGAVAADYGNTKRYIDTTPDADLGAVFLNDADANGPPPTSVLGTFAGQRMYLVEADSNLLHWSLVGNYDSFPALNNVEAHNTITAIGNLDDKVILFGRDSIWIYVPSELLGRLISTQSPVGTTYPDSVRVTDGGVYFARDDGLWVFDGITSRRVSESVEPDWEEIIGTWSGDASTKRILYSTASGAITAERGIGGIMWTKLDTDDTPGLVVKSLDNDVLYGMIARDDATGTDVVEMFGGTDEETMTLQTKNWGGGQVYRGWANHMDIDPQGNTISVTVATTTGDTCTYTVNGTGRRQYRSLLPRDLRGEYFNVKIVGKCRVYGVRLEVLR